MKTVGGGQIAGSVAGGGDRGGVLGDGADSIAYDGDVQLAEPRDQSSVEGCTAYSEARAGRETGVDLARAVEVADPVERAAGQLDTEPSQVRNRAVGDALPTSLVDRSRARLDHNDRQSGQSSADRSGSTCRPSTGNEQIDHLASTVPNAVSSVRIRTASKGALSSVKTIAVIHAE